MPPESLQLALFIIEEGIKLEPAVADELRALFTKADPTPADWAALRAKVVSKNYAAYVPASALTAGVAAPQADKPSNPPAPTPEPAPAAATPAPQVFTGQAVDPHA